MQPTSQFDDGIGIARLRISEDVFDDVASLDARDDLFHYDAHPGDEPIVGFVLFG